ncbi:MAG: hypothetical protein IT384_09625 [Deltaproteobacteria bacterium]|nr:hypothetical protein [Deltaproteobacteria bacterium]
MRSAGGPPVVAAVVALAGALAIALGPWSGCANDRRIYLPPPIPEASTALIYGVRSRLLHVRRADAPFVLTLPAEETELQLAAYRETPDELDLSPDRVEPKACRPCGLLDALGSFSADLTQETPEWVPEDAPSSALLEHALPDRRRCETCSEFAATKVPLPGDPDTECFTLPTDGRRALVLRATGEGYWIDGTAHVELACSGGEQITTANASGPGVIWTSDREGRLSRWEVARLLPDQPCSAATTTRTAPAGEALGALSVAPDSEPMEAFVVGESGQVYRRTDAGWEKLGAPLAGNNDYTAGWFAPGYGLGSVGIDELIWVRDGLARRTTLLIGESRTRVTAARYISGAGVVLGTRNRLLVLEDGQGGFRAPRDTSTTERVEDIARWRESLVFNENAGWLREFHPRVGYCDAQMLFEGRSASHLVALDDETVIVAQGSAFLAKPRIPNPCPP